LRLRYNTEKLEQMIYDFHVATGISASVFDVHCRPVANCHLNSCAFCALVQSTGEGVARCHASDERLLSEACRAREAVTRPCHAGLADTAVPIYSQNTLLGYIVFGQIGRESDGKFEEILKNIQGLGVDPLLAEQAFRQVVSFDSQKLKSAASLATMLTKYILLEHLIEPDTSGDLEAVTAYIEEHLTEELTVSSICRRFHTSKNRLYDLFREQIGYTVKEYINERRIGRAEELLKTTSHSVRQVGELCGIDHYQYFCRLFKEKKGHTPLQFRKQWAKKQNGRCG